MLTQSELKEYLSYDKDTGIFTWIKKTNNRSNRIFIGKIAGHYVDNYIRIGIFKKEYLAHQLAWLYVNGIFPNSNIDHIDGNKSNNSIDNLRICNQSQNQQNRKTSNKNNKLNLMGVCLDGRSKKYIATITLNRKQIWLGSFDTPELAHTAYLNEKRMIHNFNTL
jgi:hypothetical protein